MKMSKPPEEIDGAKVIEWAYSGGEPFGLLHYDSGKVAAEIYGLAICSYSRDEKVYRFSCNNEWKTEQDSDYNTIDEAKNNLPIQYQKVKAIWQKYE
jgi:hypothetical protein